MVGETERRPFRASNREMGSKPGGTESVLCRETQIRTGGDNDFYFHSCMELT